MFVSTRKYDQVCEAIISRYLDTYFYALYDEKSERVYDKELQVSGADVVVDGKTFIDEKVKLYPMNEYIRSLAFEMQFRARDGKFVDGWFVKENSVTTHYNIVTAFLYGKKERLEDIDDIEYLNLLFVSKESLRKFIFSATPLWRLKADMEGLRNRAVGADRKGKMRKKYAHGKFWLTKSTSLYEEPINISVPRETLSGLRNTTEFCVTRYGVEKVVGDKEPIVLKMSRDGELTPFNDMSFA